MTWTNTTTTFGSVSKMLHWLTVLLVCAVIPLGAIANGLAEQLRDPAVTSTAEDLTRAFRLFSLHKTVGVMVLAIGLTRLIWAATQTKPAPLNPQDRAGVFLAETVHILLYGSLVLVPLTGWISHAALPGFAPILWPLGQSLPFVTPNEDTAALFARLHRVFEPVLVLAILLHVAGALKHHFLSRDATLRRMLPGTPALPELPRAKRGWRPVAAAFVIWAGALAIATATGFLAG